MATLENMDVAYIFYNNWGDESDPKSDWSLLRVGATFSHLDMCEFIIYVGGDNWDHWKIFGYSEELISLAKAAKEQGYRYLCLYS